MVKAKKTRTSTRRATQPTQQDSTLVLEQLAALQQTVKDLQENVNRNSSATSTQAPPPVATAIAPVDQGIQGDNTSTQAPPTVATNFTPVDQGIQGDNIPLGGTVSASLNPYAAS